MYYVIESSRGMPVIMPCEQPDARLIGRAASLQTAREILWDHLTRKYTRRLWAALVGCACLVALLSGALL